MMELVKTSLPSRERGLKLRRKTRRKTLKKSLPSRERGLKYCADRYIFYHLQSLPSRERGLKSPIENDNSGKLSGRSLRGSVD